MAKLTVKAGSTSRLEHVFILDSASTTGAGKTALTNASVTMHYFRPGDSTPTAVTLSAGTLATWTSGGFVKVQDTDMPGVYEVGIPNAVFAAGANHAVVMIKGTGIAPVVLEYDLVSYDPLDTVRLGLTSIPNVAQGTSGALPTGNATGQVTVATNNDKTGYALTQAFPTNFSSLAITAGGAVTAGTVSDKTGYALTQAFPTNFSSLAITAGGAVTAGTVSDKTGYALTQTFPTNFSAMAITAGGAVTAGTVSDKTGYSLATAPPTAAQISTQVWSEPIPGTFGAGTAGAKLNSASSAGDPWATALPGSYAAGTAGNILGNRLDAAVSTRSTLTATNVWSEALPGTYTSGQAGFKLNAAGSAADPWSTALPGSYAAGSAGYIIGNNLNATVGSRSTLAATDVWAAATRTLTAGTNIVLSKGTGITGFNDLSSTNVSDAIWGSLVSTYDPTSSNTTATFGKAILKSDQASKNGDVTMYSISGTNGIDVDVHRIANDVTAATNLKAILNNTSTVTIGAQFNATGNAAIVDKLLGRNIAGATDGGRTVTEALRILRNKFTASGTTLTVYAENDTTVSWTSTLSTDAAATPITGSDPA